MKREIQNKVTYAEAVKMVSKSRGSEVRNRDERQPITEPDQAKEGILMVDLKKLVSFIAEVKSKTENTDNRKGSSSSPKYQR